MYLPDSRVVVEKSRDDPTASVHAPAVGSAPDATIQVAVWRSETSRQLTLVVPASIVVLIGLAQLIQLKVMKSSSVTPDHVPGSNDRVAPCSCDDLGLILGAVV
jgi:hypothetical protein